jgi:hypothetical protein
MRRVDNTGQAVTVEVYGRLPEGSGAGDRSLENLGVGKRSTKSARSAFVQRLLANPNRRIPTRPTLIADTSDGVVLHRARVGLAKLREQILRGDWR